MPVKNNAILGFLGAAGASFLFSTSTTVRALFDFPGTPLSVASWRLFIGGFGIALYVLSKNKFATVLVILKNPIIWILGSTALYYQQAMYFAAPRIGVAVAALIAVGTSSFMSGFFAWIFGLGKPSKFWAVSTAFAVFGLGLLTSFNGQRDLLAFGAVALAGIGAALYIAYGVRVAREKNVSGMLINSLYMIVAAIVAAPIAFSDPELMLDPKTIFMILYLGIFTTTFANICYGIGMHHLAPGTASTTMLLDPVLSTTWGIVILHEQLSLQGWLGCLIILAALALLAYSESRTPMLKKGEEASILA